VEYYFSFKTFGIGVYFTSEYSNKYELVVSLTFLTLFFNIKKRNVDEE
jgi:hypothetical protein